MKGYRTIIIGALMVIAPPLLSYMAAVNWSSVLSTQNALLLSGAITIAMRLITNTPPGKGA